MTDKPKPTALPYHDLPGVNWSRLKVLRTSPHHYRHQQRFDANAPARHAVRVGLATHTLVLEPHLFESRYAVYGGKARRGREWTDFKEAHPDHIWLNEAEHERATNCAQIVSANAVVAELLSCGASEVILTWTDEATGVACKCRVDHAFSRLVELKTTATIEDRLFSALCARMGYHCQLAFYQDGLVANGHTMEHGPVLIVVESVAPYDVVVYDVPDDVIGLGRREYRRLLERLVECEQTSRWPGVADERRQILQLPEWAYYEPDDELELTTGGVGMSF